MVGSKDLVLGFVKHIFIYVCNPTLNAATGGPQKVSNHLQSKDKHSTHDWNNDKPCERVLESLERGLFFYTPLFDFCHVYRSASTLYLDL